MNNAHGTFGDLLSRIENLRQLMIIAGRQYGICSPETLRYSEELDELIFQFQLHNQ